MFSCLLLASVACWTLLFAVSHSKLWEPILISLVGGLIPGLGIRQCWCPYCCKWIGFAQKFGPALLRPSPTTYPKNGTNPCADLVEAESLVICEEITWRPLLFWSLVPVDCRPRSVVLPVTKSWLPVQAIFTSNINQVLVSCPGNFYQ